MNTKKIATLALMSAISIILVFSLRIPMFPAAPFLEYDPADIPIILSTFIYGPGTGLILTLIVCVLQGLTVSAASGPIGILMHFVATGSFVLTAGFIFKALKKTKLKTIYGLIISTVCGTLVWLVSMIFWNILMTPIFMGVPREAVYQIMLPAIIPHNIVKPALNATIACVLYFALREVIKHFNAKTATMSEIADDSDNTDGADK